MPQKILGPDRGGYGDVVVPISLGGTGADNAREACSNLGIVRTDSINAYIGVVGLDAEGKVPNNLAACDDSTQVMISGKRAMLPATRGLYQITNYDSRGEYTVTCENGIVTRMEDYITYVTPATGLSAGFTVNGKHFPISILPSSIAKPSILYPVTGTQNMDVNQTFLCSKFTYIGAPDTFMGTTWQISTLPDFSTLFANVDDSVVCASAWPLSGLTPNTVFYVRVRQKGTLCGYSEWSDTVSFKTINQPFVARPTITSPTDGSVNVPLSMLAVGSAFTAMLSADTHQSSDWQLALDKDFTNVVSQVTASTANKTTWNMVAMAAVTQFWVRVRYTGVKNGTSAWSLPVSFKTQINPYVAPPTITSPTDGATELSPMSLTLTESAFAVVAGTDTLKGSHWQLSTDASFTNIVDQYYNGNSGNVYNWVKTGLSSLTTYYVRARQQGTTYGWSAFGPAIHFSTKAAPTVAAPSIVSPAAGTTDVSRKPTFTCSAFAVINGTDTQAPSQWEVYSDMTLATLVASGTTAAGVTTFTSNNVLSGNTMYYARVRHQGVTYGYSAWSLLTPFTTNNVGVLAPSVTSPTNGAGEVDVATTFTSSAFNAGVLTDTHKSSNWQIATDVNFTDIVKQVTGSTTAKTSWAPGGLSLKTTYYVRVQHTGTLYGDSPWSTPSSFVTRSKPITPTITFPFSGNNSRNLSTTFTSSSFNNGNGSEALVSAEWVVSTSASFGTITSATTTTTNVSSSSLNISYDQQYYIKVRHQGAVTGWSDWSPVVSFTISEYIYILPPSIYVKNIGPNGMNGDNGMGTSKGQTVYTSEIQTNKSGRYDTLIDTQWQMSDTLAGLYAIEENNGVTSPLTLGTYTFNWPEGRMLYIRARHKGANYGWGSWSAVDTYKAYFLPITAAQIYVSPIVNAPTTGTRTVAHLGSSTTPYMRSDLWGAPGATGSGQEPSGTLTYTWTRDYGSEGITLSSSSGHYVDAIASIENGWAGFSVSVNQYDSYGSLVSTRASGLGTAKVSVGTGKN